MSHTFGIAAWVPSHERGGLGHLVAEHEVVDDWSEPLEHVDPEDANPAGARISRSPNHLNDSITEHQVLVRRRARTRRRNLQEGLKEVGHAASGEVHAKRL